MEKSNLQKDNLSCEQHSKDVEFFCNLHQQFCCSKCISGHIDCQVKGKFVPLEDIQELFVLQQQNALKQIQLKNQDQQKDSEDTLFKLKTLQGLKQNDILTLEQFFDDLKLKVDQLKISALSNYEQNFQNALAKIEQKQNIQKNLIYLLQSQEQQIIGLSKELDQLQGSKSKQVQSIFCSQKLKEIEENIKKQEQNLGIPDLTDELELLLNKEEFYSEIGAFNSVYSSLEPKLRIFLQEHFASMIQQQYLSTKLESENLLKAYQEEQEKIKQKQEQIEELFGGVGEGFFEEQQLQQHANINNFRQKFVQLRYYSNELYVFDSDTEKFETFYLYTSQEYKVPFIIFNNCCSTIIKNHLIFLFGGEDPSNKDKTSERSFCININKKSDRGKVVVYELDSMLNPRQEFTQSTVNNYVYLISGYDVNLPKDRRIITKCEKFDLKTKKFYEIRDINYPRQHCSALCVNNQNIYVFGGKNPKYLTVYVDKIEKYIINLNDWVVLKHHVAESVEYLPPLKAALFKTNESDIVILGGNYEDQIFKTCYVFDMKTLILVKKNEELLETIDEFTNQNDLFMNPKDQDVLICSANYAKKVYRVHFDDLANKLSIAYFNQNESEEDNLQQ